MPDLTSNPLPLRYHHPSTLREAKYQSNKGVKTYSELHYVSPTPTEIFKRQDENLHDPGVKRITEVKQEWLEDGTCSVCKTYCPVEKQSTGCSVCRLASLYTTGSSSPEESEENIYRTFLLNETKRIETLTDSELDTFLKEIIQVQSIIEKARRTARISVGLAEGEVVKRRVKRGIKKESGERKKRMTADEKADEILKGLDFNFDDLLK